MSSVSVWNWSDSIERWMPRVGVRLRDCVLVLLAVFVGGPIVIAEAATSTSAQTSRLVVRLDDSDRGSGSRRVWIVRHAPDSARGVVVVGEAVLGRERGREIELDLDPGSYEVVSLASDPWSLPVRRDVRADPGRSFSVVLPTESGGASGWRSFALANENGRGGVLGRELDTVEWAASRCVRLSDDGAALPSGPEGLAVRLAAFDTIFAAWNRDPTTPIAELNLGESTEHGVPARALTSFVPMDESGVTARLLSNGPLIDLWVNREPAGGRVPPAFGQVHCRLRVRAPAWMPLDRVAVLVNGDVVQTYELERTGELVRLNTRVSLDVERDSWIAVVAVGDDPMPALATSQRAPALAVALTTPVWVDAENDGVWSSLVQQSRDFLAVAETAQDVGARWGAAGPNGRVAMLSALRSFDSDESAGAARSWASDLHAFGLADSSGLVRAAAIRGVGSSIARDGPDASRWRRLIEFAVGLGCDDRVAAAVASTGVTGGKP